MNGEAGPVSLRPAQLDSASNKVRQGGVSNVLLPLKGLDTTSRDEQQAAFTAALRARLGGLADHAMETIAMEIPAYAAGGQRLLSGVREHVLAHYKALIDSFEEGEVIELDDLEFTRLPSTQRVNAVSLGDFVYAFRIGETILWEAARRLAEQEDMKDAALSLASHGFAFGGRAAAATAARFSEAARLMELSGQQVRRDLLDDLIGGNEITSGPRREALRTAGLSSSSGLVAISAAPVEPDRADYELHAAATALATAAALGGGQPLTDVRDQEVIVIAPLASTETSLLADRLEAAAQRLANEEGALTLMIGVSERCTGLERVPDAYREACTARQQVGVEGGVFPISSLNVFQRIALSPGGVAGRRVSTRVRAFVNADLDGDGALLQTLKAYVDADLNITAAAEALHLHVNSARYRLRKISEATDTEMRSVSDVVGLLMAAHSIAGASLDGSPVRERDRA